MQSPRLYRPNRIAVVGLYYRDSLNGRSDAEEPAEGKARPQEDALERITIKVSGKIKVVRTEEIEYLQADGDYVTTVTCDGRWMKEQTMRFFEERLPAGRFARIHRSYIVNMDRIVKIERYGNLHQVSLRSGDKIRMSATGYKLLKEKLNL